MNDEVEPVENRRVLTGRGEVRVGAVQLITDRYPLRPGGDRLDR